MILINNHEIFIKRVYTHKKIIRTERLLKESLNKKTYTTPKEGENSIKVEEIPTK
jgi:hypothetical protein